MQEFIAMVARQLGTTESTARSATGGILRTIRNEADPNDATQFLTSLPGATELLESTNKTAVTTGAGGLLSGALSSASTLTGGKLGGALGLIQTLTEAGLDKNQLATFATMFLDFAKQKAGGGLVNRVLGKLPELRQLVG